jgi:hypothetical protein
MKLRFNRADVIDIVLHDQRLFAGPWFRTRYGQPDEDCPGCLVGRLLLRTGVPLKVATTYISQFIWGTAAKEVPRPSIVGVSTSLQSTVGARFASGHLLLLLSDVFEMLATSDGPPSAFRRAYMARLFEELLPESFEIELLDEVAALLPAELQQGVPEKVAAQAFVEAVLAGAPDGVTLEPEPAPEPVAATAETPSVPTPA